MDLRYRAAIALLLILLVAGLMPEKPRWGLATCRWLGAAIRSFPMAALLALALVATAFVLLFARTEFVWDDVFSWAALLAGIFVAAVVYVVALAAAIALRALRCIPANGYGLCSGLGDADALTPWLHATLQSLAGLEADRPLRFGDLWRGAGARTDYIAAEARHRPGLRAIDLRLMTTALSHGRPYSFPLDSDAFCFDEAEMRLLFPATVVEAMVASSPGRIDDGVLAGRYRLPATRSGARRKPEVFLTNQFAATQPARPAIQAYPRTKQPPGSSRM